MHARILIMLPLLLLAFVLTAHSQNLTGKYEGTADIRGLGKMDISAELREKNGKISGVIHTPRGDAEIIKGSVASGVVSITADAGGDDLVLDGKVAISGSIVGQVSGAVAKGTFELRRVGDLPALEDLAPVIHQSKDKWRGDLRYLATELPKKHKNAFNRISKDQWDASIARLDSQIAGL